MSVYMAQKAIYWLLTLNHHEFVPFKHEEVQYIRGQVERGQQSDYLHWQLFVVFTKQVRLGTVKRLFGKSVHAETARSEAAFDYVWKDDTAVEGPGSSWACERCKEIVVRIGPGSLNLRKKATSKKSRQTWWCEIITNSSGLGWTMLDLLHDKFPSEFLSDLPAQEKSCCMGEAGLDAYPKDPLSKFWDGYSGQESVVIDEFRGVVSISHLLRWLDRYQCSWKLRVPALCSGQHDFGSPLTYIHEIGTPNSM